MMRKLNYHTEIELSYKHSYVIYILQNNVGILALWTHTMDLQISTEKCSILSTVNYQLLLEYSN